MRASSTRRPYSLVGSLSDPSVRMVLKWDSLYYWVTEGWRKKSRLRKDILRGVSGEARPGQVHHIPINKRV